MFLKLLGIEIQTYQSYYGLGRSTKEILIGFMGKWLRIEVR